MRELLPGNIRHDGSDDDGGTHNNGPYEPCTGKVPLAQIFAVTTKSLFRNQIVVQFNGASVCFGLNHHSYRKKAFVEKCMGMLEVWPASVHNIRRLLGLSALVSLVCTHVPETRMMHRRASRPRSRAASPRRTRSTITHLSREVVVLVRVATRGGRAFPPLQQGCRTAGVLSRNERRCVLR